MRDDECIRFLQWALPNCQELNSSSTQAFECFPGPAHLKVAGSDSPESHYQAGRRMSVTKS
jgi:hypothetical protein